MSADATGAPPGAHAPGRALVCAGLALALALLPLGGALAWVRFALSAGLVACATLSHRDGRALGAAALFASLAFKDGVLVVPQAFATLFHVVLAGSAVALAVRLWRERGSAAYRLRSLTFALGLLPLAGLWSYPTSLAPSGTLAGTARLAMLWVAALVVAWSLQTDRERRAALGAFVFAAVAVSGVAVVQWLFPDLGIGAVTATGTAPGRPAGFYMDPNFFAAHLVLAALAALALADDFRRAWLGALGAAVVLGVVVLTLSRSAWLAAGAGMAVMLVFGTKRTRVAAVTVIALALAAGVALLGPGVLADRARSILESDPGGSNATRLAMVRSSLEMAADHPLAGTGLDAYDIAYPGYQEPGIEMQVTHPHQVPFALLAETGVAGLAAMLALTVVTGISLVRAVRSRSAAGLAAASGVVALVVGSFFQYFLYFEVGWLFFGLLASTGRAPESGSTADGS